MSVSNNYFVAKGKTLSYKGQKFGEGRRFPAADLEIDQKDFDSLIEGKALVTGKIRNEFVHSDAVKRFPPEAKPKKGDGLEDMTKGGLLEKAHELGLEADKSMSKDEIIAAIREKT